MLIECELSSTFAQRVLSTLADIDQCNEVGTLFIECSPPIARRVVYIIVE